MDYNEYQELKNLIVVYWGTGNRQTLATIQNYIKTKEGCREKLIEDLKNGCHRYISFFSSDDQVQIVSDLAARIKQGEFLESTVSWMLPYVSEQSLDQILSKADDVALVKIINEIDDHIRMIGHRFCDPPVAYSWFKSTTFFSRMREKRTWRKLSKKCKKHLKK